MIRGMKNRLTVLLVLSLIAVMTRIPAAQAQHKAGFFLGYGSDVAQPGLGGMVEFSVADRWGLSPSLLIYFPESNSTYTFSWYEFNLNANYYFYKESALGLYGLGGLNYLRYTRRERFGGERHFTRGDIGFNLGAGANFNIGKKFMPFTEMKFVLGEPEQVAFFFGLKFMLSR